MATLKVENQTSVKLPKNAEAELAKALEVIPQEHVRGLKVLRLVDVIQDPRLRNMPQGGAALPGLYHPKMGMAAPWLEIALSVLLPDETFLKRFGTKLSFKRNLVALTYSLIAQHYYLTLRHSVKRTQLESSVKTYTEKYLRVWGEKNQSRRARWLKPLQPTFERWARALQKKAVAMEKNKKA